MGSTDYEHGDLSGNFAYKVHSILEGLGDNESSFENEENLREKVSEFYNGFSEKGGTTGMAPRFIENQFEAYLENDEEFDNSSYLDGVHQYIHEPNPPVELDFDDLGE